MNGDLRISSRAFIVVLAALLLVALGPASAGAQDYTVPTTPEYLTPDTGAAPDEGAGAPAEEAPDAGAAPDAGDQAPRTLPAGTLPLTGNDEVAFLSVFGFVLLLGGFAVRRGLRASSPA